VWERRGVAAVAGAAAAEEEEMFRVRGDVLQCHKTDDT
jgi:hypothetical protein